MNEDTKKLIIGGVGMLVGIAGASYLLGRLLPDSAQCEQIDRMEKEAHRAMKNMEDKVDNLS